MQGKTVNEISVGDSAEFTKTVTETDVYNFAGVTGDFNPAHINEVYARGTMFKKRIAHGMLSVGFISNILGTQLPGAGAIYMKQELKFLAPVFIDDTITARCTATEVNKEKNRVTLRTTCENQDGNIVIDGEALMMPPK